jgi:O-antigen/teichoic acid export membrane protein
MILTAETNRSNGMSIIKTLKANLFKIIKEPWFNGVLQAIFTQGMLSAASFLVNFLVAKFATKEQYGIFVILFSILGIAANYQGAFINAPLIVLAPKKEPQERSLFVWGLGFGQWLYFLVFVGMGFVGSAIYYFLYHDHAIFLYAMVLSFASVGLLLREFIRAINYSNSRIGLLVKTDALSVLIIGTGLFMLFLKQEINSMSPIIILGIGYFCASLVGLRYENDHFKYNWGAIKNALKETWQYSRWACVGVTNNIISGQGYIYITSVYLGFGELAEISVARLFMGPVNLFVGGSNKIIMAQGATVLARKGVGKLREYILLIEGMLVVVWALYLLCLLIIYDSLISILGSRYENIQRFILCWSLFCLVNLLRTPISNGLLVLSEFKSLAKYDIAGALVTIPFCVALTMVMGGIGAIIALISGEAIMLLLSWYKLMSFQPNGAK